MNHPPDYYKNLITQFLERKVTDEQIDELHQWLQLDPLHHVWFDEINQEFQNEKVQQHFTREKVEQAWLRFQGRIQDEDSIQSNVAEKESAVIELPIRKMKHLSFLKIAASFTLLFVTAALLYKLFPAGTNITTEKITVFNAPSKTTHIILPDSTLVWLNANSTLEYPENFGVKERRVKLQGEAFFDVRKKGNQNFVVETDQLWIRVKGTRFNVSAYHDEDANTTLEEGKVELLINGDSNPYNLTPGDQVTVKRNEGKITRQKVDPSNYTAWKEAELVFDNVPLSEIILKLENRFKVRVEISEEIAQRERLTMKITNETIEEILELIELSSRLHYIKNENQITIYE